LRDPSWPQTCQIRGKHISAEVAMVFVDQALCASCPLVLPKIGLELGNPTVTFVPAVGEPRTMRNGDWDKPKGQK